MAKASKQGSGGTTWVRFRNCVLPTKVRLIKGRVAALVTFGLVLQVL
jgi:hypothetical protein